MSNSKILNFYSSTNTGFLHARGKSGTVALVEALECKPGEKILELGFGTAATLASLIPAFPDSTFYGVESSVQMYAKALARLKFCGIKNSTNFKLQEANTHLPFDDNLFDKIYVESVLAIQQGNLLQTSLLELHRILKPGGMLVFNETIWLENISVPDILEINKRCTEEFGIIQANDIFPYRENWIALLKNLNFEIISVDSLNNYKINSAIRFNFNKKSEIFSFLGKIKSKTSFSLLKQSCYFKTQMRKIVGSRNNIMEGVMVKVVKIG